MVFGFMGAGLVGAVGAFVLNTLGRTVDAAPQALIEQEAPAPIRVSAAGGSVHIVTPAGTYRPARVGDSMLRPAGIRVESADAFARLARGSVDVLFSHHARVAISPKGGSLTLYPSRGRVIVSSAAQPVEAVVAPLDLVVRGRAFGLWVHEREAWIAVLGEDVRVIGKSGTEEVFGPGREIIVTRNRIEPRARPPQLEVEGLGISARGGRNIFSGKTSPFAQVLVRASNGTINVVDVAPDGTFSAVIARDRPRPGEVIAHDAAGRFAEIGLPVSTAGSIEDAIRGLTREMNESEKVGSEGSSRPVSDAPVRPAASGQGPGADKPKLEW